MTRLNVVMYGYLVSRVAHAHPDGGRYDVSMAFGETQRAMQKEAAKPGKDFGELVRERRRRFGLPNQPAEKILPFQWYASRSQCKETGVFSSVKELSLTAADGASEAVDQELQPADLAVQAVEYRMQEALDALEAAALRGATPSELETLETAFISAESAYTRVCLRRYEN